MNGTQDIRGRLEAQYQGTAAYLSQLEKADPKDIKVTDRSTLAPADETSCIKVSDAKKEGQLNSLDSRMKGSLQPSMEEMEEMKKRQKVRCRAAAFFSIVRMKWSLRKILLSFRRSGRTGWTGWTGWTGGVEEWRSGGQRKPPE